LGCDKGRITGALLDPVYKYWVGMMITVISVTDPTIDMLTFITNKI